MVTSEADLEQAIVRRQASLRSSLVRLEGRAQRTARTTVRVGAIVLGLTLTALLGWAAVVLIRKATA